MTALVLAALLGVKITSPDGDLFAFPSLLDDRGTPMAVSTFEQWADGERLHVRITHAFPDGRRAVERARFLRKGELVQETWSWDERREGELVRAYRVDLLTGRARVRKREDGKEKRWESKLHVSPGRLYAGVGVTYAVKNLRDRLVKGEEIRLRTVGFLPKPLSVRIRVKHAGTEEVEIGGRRVEADRMEVKLDLHGLEKVVELAKGKAGAEVWLRRGGPPMILRIRFPLVEAGDPVVVLETLGSPRTPHPERGTR